MVKYVLYTVASLEFEPLILYNYNSNLDYSNSL